MPKTSTYTVHGHMKNRDGTQSAFWTRTRLSKAQAQKLAKEQRAESGGVAKIIAEDPENSPPAYGKPGDPPPAKIYDVAKQKWVPNQKAKRHHATKKSPAQLQREIDEALANKQRGARGLIYECGRADCPGTIGTSHPKEQCPGIDKEHKDTPLQESTAKKAAWLKGAKRRFRLGARVRVVKSDVPEYIGARGKVIDYSLGTEGDWPLISVGFDAPIKTSSWGAAVKHDAFYGDGTTDDEIVLDRTKRKS